MRRWEQAGPGAGSAIASLTQLPWLLPFLLRLVQQALVDERSNSIQHPASHTSRSVAPGAAYHLCCGKRTSADEDRESPKEPLLIFIQQVVAPLDCVMKRLLPLRQGSRPTGRHVQQ